MSGLPRNPGRSGRETFPGRPIGPDACEGRRKRKWQKGKRRGPGRGRPAALGEPGACMLSRMGAGTGPPEMPRSPQRTSGTPVWPCSHPPHGPRARVAELFGLREGLSSPAGTWVRVLQVLGVSAALLLVCLSLAHLLGPAEPVEGPTGPRFPLSWTARPLQDACSLALVESIPQDLPATANSSARPLAQAWMQLLDMAQESVHVASFYWSLTGRDIGVNDSSSQPGETLLQKLQQLLGRNVSLAVATSTPSLAPNSSDLQSLVALGAQVRHVPMKKLTGGVLHSKFWVVDGRHIYVGSANMDWRSLTQVKELGVIVYNCSRLAQDLEKTFQTYWALGVPRPVLPSRWPRNFSSHINRFQPLREHFSGLPTTAYFSASPPALCPSGRTRDLDALLTEIGRAREFVYVSVMEYFPTTRFQHPVRYWPVLDTALRTAAVSRRVHVRLLVSCWLNTDPRMFPFLRSLQALSHPAAGISLDVKVYIVPVGNHSNIPFSRVNHSKFMVTEQVAYIGTSNWSEDYFSSTSGVGLVLRQRATGSQPQALTVQEQLRRLFERDWSSPYAVGLDELAHSQDCVWRH